MTAPIAVLIVDDSPSARAVLRQLLAGDPGIEVIGAAPDAFAAAAMMRDRLPDVLLLDLEMPRMDGLTFLGRIMAQRPLPVVICSGHSEAGSAAAMRALEMGAAEVLGKPRLGTPALRAEAQIRLCDAVRAAAQTRGRGRRTARGQNAGASAGAKPAEAPLAPGPKLTADVILPPPLPGGGPPVAMPPIIAIGASTGGTEALARILASLAPDTPPVVIVQHMPERFTATFAKRLDGLSRLRVTEARDGDRPEPGTALVAPGDHHLILHRQGRGYRVTIISGPYVARHRPSVDVLFRSTAIAAGPAAMGLLLTGMGDDGARGLLEMRQAGALTIVQDEATSVVWGMPGEAFRMGAASRAVPLTGCAAEIASFAAATAGRVG